MALMAGHEVSGSDRGDSVELKLLRDAGAAEVVGLQQAANVKLADVVVRSVAVPDDNPEILAARTFGIPVWTRTECLARLLAHHETVAVAGSFGKTTTASLLADCMCQSADPVVYVGARPAHDCLSVRWGRGRLAVVEACEYRREFFHLAPAHLLLTNIAVNHEDEFGDGMSKVLRTFESFIRINERALHSVWVGLDDPGLRLLHKRGILNARTYGTQNADWDAVGGFDSTHNRTEVRLLHRGKSAGTFWTHWYGPHIVRNLVPVLGFCKEFGVSGADVRRPTGAT